MNRMFYLSSFTGNIGQWDVSSVTDMSYMFAGDPMYGVTNTFTGDISKWDVSAVTTMGAMFYASSFTGDISKWDVSA
eukprot:995421-Rhodomonas_salina.1